MRMITSPNTFKTCYIAQMKEELGLPVRTSSNRKEKFRSVRVTKELKPFIKKAIQYLLNTNEKMPTYKEIQQKSFDIYMNENKKSKSESYYGIFQSENKNSVIQTINDRNIFYEL